SRPQYHGALVAVWALIPALLVLGLWALFGNTVLDTYVMGLLPPDIAAQSELALGQSVRRVQAIASGYGVAGELAPWEQAAGDALRQFQFIVTLMVLLAAAGTGILALLYARQRIAPRLRARNQVERLITVLLFACS